MSLFPEDKKKKTKKNLYEPSVDGGYRPWDVEWRDKYIYGTIKKSWEEMTPEERMAELRAEEYSEKYGFDYQKASREDSGGVILQRLKSQRKPSDLLKFTSSMQKSERAKPDYTSEKSQMITIMGASGLLSAFFVVFAFPGLILTLPPLLFAIIAYGYYEFAEKSKFASIAYLVFVVLGILFIFRLILSAIGDIF